jgi:hypothetical protein
MEKRKDKAELLRDRVGEVLKLEMCPACREHPDCFSWIDGRCTALKKRGDQDCVFYKPMKQAAAENQAIYENLLKDRRYDLIEKYQKSYAALGIEDPEFRDSEGIRRELERMAADETGGGVTGKDAGVTGGDETAAETVAADTADSDETGSTNTEEDDLAWIL